MPKKRILVLGANPAWQENVLFADFAAGKVNRAERREEYAAGKGVNFCRAAACLGQTPTRLFQFAGGENGAKLRRALRDEGIDAVTVATAGETRRCLTCLDGRRRAATELILPAAPVAPEDGRKILRRLKAHLDEAAGLAIVGSLPPGLDPADFYAELARLAEKARLPLLIDAFAGIEPLLAARCDQYLKINEDEFRALFPAGADVAAATGGADGDARRVVAVTRGGKRATLYRDGRRIGFRPPAVGGRMVSPIGSGDTASAVFFAGILAGRPPADAFADALAAAGANCLNARAGFFTRADYTALRRTMTTARRDSPLENKLLT